MIIAKVAPRRAHNPKVVGSNPTPATNVRPVLIGGFFVCGIMGIFEYENYCEIKWLKKKHH